MLTFEKRCSTTSTYTTNGKNLFLPINIIACDIVRESMD